MRTRQRERLPQLLYDPLARWMRRRVEVENALAAVFDYKEAIKHTKRFARRLQLLDSGCR